MSLEAIERLRALTRDLSSAIVRPPGQDVAVETVLRLCELAEISDWNDDDLASVDLFARRIDIDRGLHAAYSATGRRRLGPRLSDHRVLELAIAVICRALLDEDAAGASRSRLLRRMNTLFKSMDMVPVAWLGRNSLVGEAIISLMRRLVAEPADSSGVESVERLAFKPGGSMVTLPLTVLFHEGPIARAYLETIHSLGFRVQTLIHLVAGRDLATKKVLGRWLPGRLRLRYADAVQRGRIHHWPRRIAAQHRDLVARLKATVEGDFGFAASTIEAAYRLRELSIFADEIVAMVVDGLGDDVLVDHLKASAPTAVLFTGGGIVPKRLLKIPQLRFLHVHPGYLPAIRGADGMLWSSLLTGHTSASCFVMVPGIDTGDLIMARWLPRTNIGLSASPAIDEKTRYRSAYAFLDPWVRSFVLREVLVSTQDLAGVEARPQDHGVATTYTFMHERIRAAALKGLLEQG